MSVDMKKLLASFLVVGAVMPVSAWACDDYLKTSSAGLMGADSFRRDCDFQDRYARVKETFARYGRNVEDVTEYKALRFIGSQVYTTNLQTKKLPPQMIYEPAPATWQIWESGVDQVVQRFGRKDSLLDQNTIKAETISFINKSLMEKDGVSLKDKEISSKTEFGVYRSYTDNSSGYCIDASPSDQRRQLDESRASVARFQAAFENRVGKSFVSLVTSKKGKWPEKASMDPGMIYRDNACGKSLTNSFMYYSPGYMVENQIDWIRIFAEEVLKSYKVGQPMLAPTEFAAIVQKWVVSVHPFVDGNGRTSRGVQDIITRSFGVPFAPTGTLQNDALETLDIYVQNTYRETDKMLGFLEYCASTLQSGRDLDYRCKSIAEQR